MAERTLVKRWGYDLLRFGCRLAGVALFGLRAQGREHTAFAGPALVCANHQSYLDPIVIGCIFNRRMNYLARKSLFRFFVFRWLIEFLDAIPVDAAGGGISGLKESLRRLRSQELVLIFPEGARTWDGEVAPLMPGFCVLARRAQVPLLPVALEGPFAAWPRMARWPRLARCCAVVGQPITADEVKQWSDEQLVGELERRIRACHFQARALLSRRTGQGGVYDHGRCPTHHGC